MEKLDHLEALRLELEALHSIETEKNLLVLENSELRHTISSLRIENVTLKQDMDGMSDDMGMLEAKVLELMRQMKKGTNAQEE